MRKIVKKWFWVWEFDKEEQWLNEMAAKGVAVIMVSSELPEVLGMSDRIMVVHEGHVTGIIDAAGADQAKVMTLATGGSLV